VSLLSDAKVPVEVISRLVGHRSTTVTETVYRKQLRPVVQGGADAMNRIFPAGADRGALVTHLVTQRCWMRPSGGCSCWWAQQGSNL
jgi:hypothetical protein